jgi:hypothetical protein
VGTSAGCSAAALVRFAPYPKRFAPYPERFAPYPRRFAPHPGRSACADQTDRHPFGVANIQNCPSGSSAQ